jgi:hypothetical protein
MSFGISGGIGPDRQGHLRDLCLLQKKDFSKALGGGAMDTFRMGCHELAERNHVEVLL